VLVLTKPGSAQLYGRLQSPPTRAGSYGLCAGGGSPAAVENVPPRPGSACAGRTLRFEWDPRWARLPGTTDSGVEMRPARSTFWTIAACRRGMASRMGMNCLVRDLCRFARDSKAAMQRPARPGSARNRVRFAQQRLRIGFVPVEEKVFHIRPKFLHFLREGVRGAGNPQPFDIAAHRARIRIVSV